MITRVPVISLLRGEKHCETILTLAQEPLYLDVAPDPLQKVATVLLDTGLRMRELLTLDWHNVHIDPPAGSAYGYLTVVKSKAKNSKRRNVPLTARVDALLREIGVSREGLVFCKPDGSPLCQTYLNEQARKVRTWLKLPTDLTPHSFGHTFGTRLGESGADVFTIMKLMGHSSVTVSQRYVHPSPELIERAFSRFEKLGVVSKLGIVDGEAGRKTSEVV